MPPREKKKQSPEEELVNLEELMVEQTAGAVVRAQQDKGRLSASYIAKGQSLVLLIVRAEGMVPKKRLYLCQIVDVKDS